MHLNIPERAVSMVWIRENQNLNLISGNTNITAVQNCISTASYSVLSEMACKSKRRKAMCKLDKEDLSHHWINNLYPFDPSKIASGCPQNQSLFSIPPSQSVCSVQCSKSVLRYRKPSTFVRSSEFGNQINTL